MPNSAVLRQEDVPANRNLKDVRPSGPAPVTVARGDGIGPEIMGATLHILQEAGAQLDIEEITIGQQLYERGISAGIEPESWDSLRRTRTFLKAPLTTPQGGGAKSLNVTVRKTLGLFANVRPCRSYDPIVPTRHPGMDLVVVRENEEDTYGGIEHRQTDQVTQCLKLITRPGTERVMRYAFEYARRQGRRKVTCLTKDNIMKLTDGLFHRVFEEIAPEYPDLTAEHLIVDIGTARLADRPEDFDVVVTPNLYGDIVSDITALIAGSVGMAGSANIGAHCAMFEAVHGSAPDIAGQDLANPSGLLNGAVLMLHHLGQSEVAARIENAWRVTLERGIHTADVFDAERSRTRVGTKAFAEAVVDHLGLLPETLPAAEQPQAGEPLDLAGLVRARERATKTRHGVDVFLDYVGTPDSLGDRLRRLASSELPLTMITNRGVKVYPNGFPETFCTDHWRCRFEGRDGSQVGQQQILDLQSRLVQAGYDVIKTEHLCAFDGQRGYSLGQGQ